MRKKFSHRLLGCRRAQTLFAAAVLSLVVTAPGGTGSAAEAPKQRAPAEQRQGLVALMTQGKLEVDLGNYQVASEAFSSIADDETAPAALRWEALVRLGLARSAAGDFRGSADAFKKVRANYSGDPEAVRFLISAVAGAIPGKIWLDLEPQFEDLLRSAQVVSVEELTMRLIGDRRVYLAKDEVELRAIFRPGTPGSNYRAYIAAYEMDKILGLDMVPPAVERAIKGNQGSLQLWVEGCETYKDLEGQPAPDWSQQRSRIETFDNLIGNRDRNRMVLLGAACGTVLVDHDLSFSSHKELESPPHRFDRHLVQRLRALDREELQGRLKGLLSNQQIESILVRRDALLAHLDKLIAERGEVRVLF
ncbi:hypothetical protein MYX65_06775 [Acidobacteria bacterium AH-259-L09]|nr:hypothetical protein [Acidobacteria bacterium AH-259-L09]